MMQITAAISDVAFYAGWIIVNGFIFYAEYDFVLRFSNKQRLGRKNVLIYVGVSCALTFITLVVPLPSLIGEMIHTAFLILFSRFMLKINVAEVIASATIIFTLSTFMEGISATVMRLLAANLNNPFVGGLLQIIITVVLTTLLYVILRFIARRYNSADIKIFIPYLYILVLPCSFTVWIIRFGMGLDRVRLYPNNAPFAEGSPLWALVCILGAFATFFVILEVFAKALKMVNRETENALLAAQLREQRIYLSEAAKRAGQYRAFQHDINNHMLILSGLIKAEKYGQAQQYFDKLNVTAGALASVVSTGSPVLDILLNEKIQYAAQNEILVSHIISLPKESTIDDIDLSVVFANALDNAINAAQKERPKDRSIDITARVKNQFLVIEITNPCHDIMPVKQGTGLKNILQITKKYHGTADICKNADEFRVSVLLCWNMPLKRPFT